MTVEKARQIYDRIQKIRRKMWAFNIVQFVICAPAAWRHGVSWPLAALSGGTFLVFTGAISTEKILLKWIDKRGGKSI